AVEELDARTQRERDDQNPPWPAQPMGGQERRHQRPAAAIPPEVGTSAVGAPLPAAPTASNEPEPPGPFRTAGLRYRGTPVRFGRAAKQRSLVLALWDTSKRCPHPARPIEDVLSEVYGEVNETEDSTFRQLCTDTRSRLDCHNCPLTIESLQGTV